MARKFVRVTLIGRERKQLVLNTDYRFSTKTIITLTKSWGSADGFNRIELRRYTSATERLVDFTDGSILRAYDLNVAQLQTIHVAEEARDMTADTISVNNEGLLDARGNRIINLGYAEDDGDAVPFGQLKSFDDSALASAEKAKGYEQEAQKHRNDTWSFRNQSETFKHEAESAARVAQNASSSASTANNAAQTAAQNAAGSNTAATAQAKAAAASATAAAGSVTKAKEWASKDRDQVVEDGLYSAKHYSLVAKDESAKLKNWNDLAGAISSVQGTTVSWKGRTVSRQFVNTMEPGADATAQPRVSVLEGLVRSGTNKVFSLEKFITSLSKRQDVYSYDSTDPTTWAAGRNNGTGVHKFRGQVNNVNGKFSVSAAIGSQAYINQLNSEGAYTQSLPGKQDISLYYPIVKQYGERTSGKKSAFSMGMTAMSTDDFHMGTMHLISSDGKSVAWEFRPNGDFKAGQGAITAGGIVSGSGLSAGAGGVSSQGPINCKGDGVTLALNNTSDAQSMYILAKTPGGNNWYLGKGGAGNEIYLHSYKLGTSLMLAADHVAVTKDLHVGTQGSKLTTNGNIAGPTWGTDLVTWIRSNVQIKGTYQAGIGEQLVWQGSAGHGVTMNLNADIRWRQVFIVINGYRFSYRFGGDGNYFMYGWGGWIKLTLSGGGRALRNNEDNQSVPTAIYMEK